MKIASIEMTPIGSDSLRSADRWIRGACPGAVNYVLPNTQMVQIMYCPTISSANAFRVIGPVI